MRSGLSSRYWAGRCVMYRIYDEDDRLLYVGSTNHLTRRLNEHGGWWTEYATRLRVQVFPHLFAARAAESVAIQEEEPLVNVIGSGRPANDKSFPNWTRLDWARAEEFRTRHRGFMPPSPRLRASHAIALQELHAALLERGLA